MRIKPVIPEDFCAWMDGYCEAFEDFPDGAWQCACEEGVRMYNKAHHTSIDLFEGWLHWVEKKAS